MARAAALLVCFLSASARRVQACVTPAANPSRASCPGGHSGEITLCDWVTEVPEHAFSGCDDLTKVTIGDSVQTIGSHAFSGCDNLTKVTIGDSVQTVGSFAFWMCTSLTEVTIGDSVESIGMAAFIYCTSLTDVTIGGSVQTVGSYAFCGCTSLAEVTIPNSVQTIGDEAFYACYSLTEVAIGDSVTSIGRSAFDSCTSLTEVAIGKSVQTIGDFAFGGCSSLTEVTIPNSVQTIADGAFGYCSSLTKVTIGDSVQTVGSTAFYQCTSLAEVTMSDSVQTIGDFAFAYCYSLTEVTFGGGIKTMGGQAFNPTALSGDVLIPRYEGSVTVSSSAFSPSVALIWLTPEPTPEPAPDPIPDPTQAPTPAPPIAAPAPGSGSVSGDPITMYCGARAEFTLPLGRWTPLLITPEFRLLAWPTRGLASEQWLARVVVASPTGERLAQVSIKEGLADANRTSSPPGAFETINVALGNAGVPLRQLPPRTVVGVDSQAFRGVELGFGRVQGSRGREYCAIMSASAHVVVVSSSAREFYGENPKLAHKFAHLDMEIFGLWRPEVLMGVLPELWGLQPLSARAASMLKAGASGHAMESPIGRCPAV